MDRCPLCSGAHSLERCPRWRVPTVLSVLALTMCTPVPAIERDGTLSEVDRATLTTCTATNPCAVWSENEIKALLIVYRQKLIEANVTCRRDRI